MSEELCDKCQKIKHGVSQYKFWFLCYPCTKELMNEEENIKNKVQLIKKNIRS
jgi:hypothetical protein